MIIGGSGSVKTNPLINLINEEHDIGKKILYARYLSKRKYEYSIKKREGVEIYHANNPKAFIDCSNTMGDVYENIDDGNPIRKRKKIIVFDDMIADIMHSRRFQALIKELFIRGIKLNISLVFITQCYFSGPKEFRLNSTHYLVMKINNRKELQNIVVDHSADIDYNDYENLQRMHKTAF